MHEYCFNKSEFCYISIKWTNQVFLRLLEKNIVINNRKFAAVINNYQRKL